MAKKVVGSIITLSLFIHAWAAVLPEQDAAQPARRHLLQYHTNMTSMWMTDDFGEMQEVYLTTRSGHEHQVKGSVENNVFFFLYTRDYNSAYQLSKNDMSRLLSSTFKPYRPTKIVIHGFWSSYQSDAVQTVREAYLNHYDVNVVGVDWSALAAGPWYLEAVDHTEPVGRVIAQFIDFLASAGARVHDIHIIGHSLGAHVCGFASNHVRSGWITRITGLDPALPLFAFRPPETRLDPSDADLVDCIHTCGGYLGFYSPICSHDFYPNGGTASQPGCHWDLTGACSHGRSYRYYSASVTGSFQARACNSLDDVRYGRCNGHIGVMGDRAPTSQPGLYYLETDSAYPYTKS